MMCTAKVAHLLLTITLAGLHGFLPDSRAASHPGDGPPFNIVMLRSSNVFSPAALAQDQQMREALERGTVRGVQFFVEILDTLRFKQPEIEKEFLSLFRKKYRDEHIDLFLAVGIDAMRFAQRYREQLMPGVPILFYNVAADAVERYPIEPGVTGVLLKFDVAGTLDLAIRLQPNARRIVVIGGQAEYDKNWLRRAREALVLYEGKLAVSYLTHLALPQILENVKKIERDTIVLFLSIVRDAAGRTYQSPTVAKQVADVSQAPVYGVIDSTLGHGIVGG
jgi:hypothetical protein